MIKNSLVYFYLQKIHNDLKSIIFPKSFQQVGHHFEFIGKVHLLAWKKNKYTPGAHFFSELVFKRIACSAVYVVDLKLPIFLKQTISLHL